MSRLSPYQGGGKIRQISTSVTYDTQVSGTTFSIGSLPKGAVVLAVILNTSASTSTATLAVGIAGTAAKYKTAAALTTANSPQFFGLNAAVLTPLTAKEDLIITTGTASLPASGTLHASVLYIID